MSKPINKSVNKRINALKALLISTFIFLSITTNSIPFSHEFSDFKLVNIEENENIKNPSSSELFENDVLFTATQDPLIINETAYYTQTSHYMIGNGSIPSYTSDYEELPIDTAHDWEGYRYTAFVSNLNDERDWIQNGHMGSDTGLTPGSHVVQTYQSSHPYGKNLNPANYISTIVGGSCNYMRLHFVRLDVEYYYDVLYISNQANTIIDSYAGNYSDIYTPWYPATTLKISMDTDASVEYYGYYIDFYETYTGSMFTIDDTNWNYYENVITDPSRLYGDTGEQGNRSTLNVVIEGIYEDVASYSYEEGDEAGFYQDLAIQRGEVTDAWVSMDYFLLHGLETNDAFAFIKINDEIVYSRGFRTITNAGLGQWHSTGLINIDLWENSSTIFNDVIDGQSLELAVGIQHGISVQYTNFDHVDIQQAYFDNIKLILKTRANSTQADINLEFDNIPLVDSISEWGSGTFNRYYTWNNNPMQVLLTVDAPKIEFDITSTIYGYHTTDSKIQLQGTDGSRLVIFTNESIIWQSYHNVYVPTQYQNYEYEGVKPKDWEILDIEDPTGLSTSFTGGQKSDSFFGVITSSSGWWKIQANSSNMLESSNTELWNGSWQNYQNDFTYDINDIIGIRSDLNMSIGPIGNILSTTADLTIYNPDDTIWHTESVIPGITGSIEFTNIEVGPSNSSGGTYQYSIVWTNGTAAGGLNGSFEIMHIIENTILYPRDAITDFDTESIFGDIIPIRFKINDSDTGVMLSSLNVEYNWTTGNETLNEISSGIYDTSLDTLDLLGSGDYSVEFTISGEGFYNFYFTINIHLVSETELKIIGLDNNIDYGTNFTIRLDYHIKPTSQGITNAQITLNISDYSVIEEATDGVYTIEINSSSSFLGPGIHDIQIIALKNAYQTQDLVTRIQILPRSVYFEIFINSVDCTSNKSYSAKIQEDLNFTIGVYTSFGDLPVVIGTVQLSDGETYSAPFTIVGEKYHSIIDSSFFGLGINFISLIFNETGYQSASEILQISITRITLNAVFNDDDTLLVTRRNDFSTQIFLEDPRTSTPILNATVSYSWIFGTGFLTDVGDGYYEFTETAPSQTGTYEITFTITTTDPDYEPLTITLTLVSQQANTPIKWWWIAIPVGLIIAMLSGSLIAIGVKQKRNKNREQEIAQLKQKTQIFDDITNIKGILLIEKNSGLLMFKHVLSGLDEENEELFSGFVRAILLLGKRFIRDDEEIEKGMVFEKQESIEFAHENFKILLVGGQKIIFALILEQQASTAIKEKATKFIEEFEGIYGSILEGWNGNRNVFEDTTPKLFEEIFNLSLLKSFKLTENSEIYEKKFVTPNTPSETVSSVIKTILEEKESFHLKTILSLIPEEEKLSAKNVILKFIKGKYIVPLD